MHSRILIITEGNMLMHQTRDKVEFTNKSNYFDRRNPSWEQVRCVPCPIWSYQKPWLMPRLTAFLTQSLSCGPCKAVAMAQAGSAFLGSASASLRLQAKPCTSLHLTYLFWCLPPKMSGFSPSCLGQNHPKMSGLRSSLSKAFPGSCSKAWILEDHRSKRCETAATRMWEGYVVRIPHSD